MKLASPPSNGSFAALRRFARRAEQPVERCALCSVPLEAEHQHLLERETRNFLCACTGCALLFANDADQKYLYIPRTAEVLDDFQLSDSQWNALLIPINMAFFFYSTPSQRVVAMYPSPAGATESLLDLSAWEDIVSENPRLGTMQEDVEALLVNRLGRPGDATAFEYYLAPIDKCYRLVGLIRSRWRGLSGGEEVWRSIRDFYDSLKG